MNELNNERDKSNNNSLKWLGFNLTKKFNLIAFSNFGFSVIGSINKYVHILLLIIKISNVYL